MRDPTGGGLSNEGEVVGMVQSLGDRALGVPLVTSAQGYDDRDEDGRGPIGVTNDWRDEVQITMWTHRREQIGGSWTIDPGTPPSWRSMEAGSRSGRVTRSRLGNDWGWVNVGQVGHFQDGVWYVNVRCVACHPSGSRRSLA